MIRQQGSTGESIGSSQSTQFPYAHIPCNSSSRTTNTYPMKGTEKNHAKTQPQQKRPFATTQKMTDPHASQVAAMKPMDPEDAHCNQLSCDEAQWTSSQSALQSARIAKILPGTPSSCKVGTQPGTPMRSSICHHTPPPQSKAPHKSTLAEPKVGPSHSTMSSEATACNRPAGAQFPAQPQPIPNLSPPPGIHSVRLSAHDVKYGVHNNVPLKAVLQQLQDRKTFKLATIGYELYDCGHPSNNPYQIPKRRKPTFKIPCQTDHELWVRARDFKKVPREQDMQWLLQKLNPFRICKVIDCSDFDTPVAKGSKNQNWHLQHHREAAICKFMGRGDTLKEFLHQLMLCMVQHHACMVYGSPVEVLLTFYCRNGRDRSVAAWMIAQEILQWLGFKMQLSHVLQQVCHISICWGKDFGCNTLFVS